MPARPLHLLLPALLALLAVAAGLAFGSAEPQGWHAWQALFDPASAGHAIVVELRLPRVLTGAGVGALLAVAGALLQVLLRNPLAEPYVLGLSGGAALGAIIAIALTLPALLISLAAALGALLSMLAVFAVARREFAGRGGNGASERLLLSGVMFAALWGAFVALVLAVAPEGKLQGMIFWLMGDLTGAGLGATEGAVMAGVLGLSLGGAVSICVTAENPHVKTLVTWSAVPKFAGWTKGVVGPKGIVKADPISGGPLFNTDRPKIDVPEAYVSLKIPKLQIQGDHDIPGFLKGFQQYFPAASAPKKHIVIADGDHVFTSWPIRRKVIQRTVDWFLKYL